MELRQLRYSVAVVEERHFGRAAARLHMTQPSLSRAVKQLETDLGTVLLDRSPAGVGLTSAGTALYEEARALLTQEQQARARVATAAGDATLTVGILDDVVGDDGTALATAFRRRHRRVRVHVRESDFADPTAGLRRGSVDVALTLAPFDEAGVDTRVLRSDPVGVVPTADDPSRVGGRCAWPTWPTGAGSASPTAPTPSGAPTGPAAGTLRTAARSCARPGSACRRCCGTGPSGSSR